MIRRDSDLSEYSLQGIGTNKISLSINSECVVFNLSDEDRPQALEVSGVNGMLFCDSRPPTRGRGYGGPSRGGPGGRRPYRTNSAPDGDGGDGGDGGEWSTVSRN